jgi:hypothetical protein
VRVGRSTTAPGKFMFFLSPRAALLRIRAITEVSLHCDDENRKIIKKEKMIRDHSEKKEKEKKAMMHFYL